MFRIMVRALNIYIFQNNQKNQNIYLEAMAFQQSGKPARIP
jgi:hypothetical protein